MDHLRREKENRERALETDNAELNEDVAQLRAEMAAVIHQTQNIINTKPGLELEIAAYRKLLENEERRSAKHSLEKTDDTERCIAT